MDPNSRLLALGAGGAPAAENLYVEDVFSTWLYTGTGSTQTITNGIDLAGEGGIVWGKQRSASANHWLMDASLGGWLVSPNQTRARDSGWGIYPTSSGFAFSFGNNYGIYAYNQSGVSEVAWTFRKAEKFFDIVTYTGNGSNRTIAHNLGSVPGTIIVKRTDTTSDWQVYHRSLANTEYMVLNSTAAKTTGTTRWNSTTPTSTEFSLGTDATVNASGGTYVAYLFAHDAGGFGDDGTESVIKCGSYTGTGIEGSPEVNLGWEPQWLLIKSTSISSTNWVLVDSMRGLPVGSDSNRLYANTSGAEGGYRVAELTATGFKLGQAVSYSNQSGVTYIYIAIRRGPMKTPTSGTEVFNATTSNSATGTVISTDFPLDMQITGARGFTDTYQLSVSDRLRGVSTTPSSVQSPLMATNSTAIESTARFQTNYWNNTGFSIPNGLGGASIIYYNFRRAPGFFDVVAYTGTGSARTVAHNLGVEPELFIVKSRSNAVGWRTYDAFNGPTKGLLLNDTAASLTSSAYWNDTSPTNSVFTVGTNSTVNSSGATYIAYLFATLPGISKVGSYTGTGTTLSIDCGFTAGARFVLIKRTDTSGDWYVWDTARGIVSGNDPYLLLNSTAAEVTSTDYIDPLSSGFQISSTAPAAINASGGSFIFLAIA